MKAYNRIRINKYVSIIYRIAVVNKYQVNINIQMKQNKL